MSLLLLLACAEPAPPPPPAPSAPPISTADGIAKSAVDPCSLSAAEIKATLGLTVAEGRPTPVQEFPGGASMSCLYDGQPSVFVKVTWLEPDRAHFDGDLKALTGWVEVIERDPDHAHFQLQEHHQTAAVHYVRQNAMVEVRVMTGPRPASHRTGLLALRRFP